MAADDPETGAADRAHCRQAAVAALIDATATRLARDGVGEPALAAIGDMLVALAARTELFGEADFPAAAPDESPGRLYALHGGAANAMALYLSVQRPVSDRPPGRQA